ncbi:MAG: sigma-70 family RNA polymerase sigma factor [Planctomycetes bacterium]|nr:sigma-70 family RNA polymerase sigma factor [Planctomycetota bacterium]
MTDQPQDPPPKDFRQAVSDLVEELLGPASSLRFADPAVLAAALRRSRGGATLEDAVLGAAFEVAKQDRLVADEFLGHFLAAMARLGRCHLRPALRRFLDTGYLVQSVLGGLWQEIAAVEFRSRGEFLAYLGQRLQWKASDRARGLRSGRRREDRRAEADPGELPPSGQAEGPATLAGAREEQELLILAVLKLPDRDRRVLTLHLRGVSPAEIAVELGLEAPAARKALERAVGRARALMER